MKKYGRIKIFIILACAFFVALPFFFLPQKAYAYSSLPTGGNAISNIYNDSTGKFSGKNLNALAKKAGDYADINALIKDVEDNNKTIKSSSFGETVVYFGKANNGAGAQFAWIPAYVSNSDVGPVLTLWFAQNSGTASFSKNSTGKDPAADNYSTSYIRTVSLNNAGQYYQSSSVSSLSSYTATSNHNFAMYTTGALKDYIVAPSQVSWQANANFLKNDPKWAVSTKVTYTPMVWLSDKLWLPSVYEVFDSNITANSNISNTNDFKYNGGLWGTSVSKLSDSGDYRLRSSYGANVGDPFLVAKAGSSINVTTKGNSRGVRPALHLNLTKVIENMEPDHIHTYSDEWTSDENKHWHAATCEHTDLKKDEAAHEPAEAVRENEVEATCSKAGSYDEVVKCSVCGYEISRTKKTIPTTDHTPETVAGKPPTCTEKGLTDGSKCSVCGKILTEQEETAASGHKWGEWIQTKDPTEETEGEEERECSVCHEKETRPVPTLDHTHKFADDWSSDESSHWHASTCGHEVKDGEAAHEWDDGEITKAATCTEEGEKTYTCTVCGHTRTESVAKSAHTEETDEAVEATCTTAGKTAGKHCSVCGEVLEEQKEVPALGHDYQAAEGGKAPTCTEDGYGKLVCSRCGDEKEGEVIPALGHKHETVAGKAATCTEKGLTDGDKCPVCGEVLEEQKEVPALGHDYQAAEGGKAPTCTEDGYGKLVCSRCGDEKDGDVIPALGHAYEWVITKPATTEEAGLMQNKCSVCGDVSEEKEIAKLEDPDGGGEIDLPVDINVEFKVTQSSTDNDYSELDGLKFGYWAQLWYRNEDGTLGGEFTDEINCFLTLKIPTEIIETIRGGEEINPERIADELKVYYIGVDGLPVPVEKFDIIRREDESWQVKFNYNAKFRAEVVFNAPNAAGNSEPAAGIPWWVWLLAGLAGAAVVGVVIVIIVVAKKKSAGAVVADNGEVLGKLDRQDQKIDRLIEISDGGFNDFVEDE